MRYATSHPPTPRSAVLAPVFVEARAACPAPIGLNMSMTLFITSEDWILALKGRPRAEPAPRRQKLSVRNPALLPAMSCTMRTATGAPALPSRSLAGQCAESSSCCASRAKHAALQGVWKAMWKSRPSARVQIDQVRWRVRHVMEYT